MSRFVEGKVREEKARLVVRLRDEQHLAFPQIAAQIGMSVSWCSQIYHYAKKKGDNIMAGEENVPLTIDDLTSLDNYGHRELKELTEIQLNEYATLLSARREEVLERIRELLRRAMRL